ncbi:hypothetical protein ES703_73805 [subsurface metagenome]
MAKPDVQKRLVNQVFEQMQKQYAEQQKAEAAELHNRFVQIVEEIRPSSENLLLVLELLRQEALQNLISRFSEIKAAPIEEPPKEA